MFDNIGGKIKGIAVWFSLIGVIAATVIGLMMIVQSVQYGGDASFLSGIITLVVGSIGAWVVGVIIYGFGQLIEDTSKIAKSIDNISENTELIKRSTGFTAKVLKQTLSEETENKNK